MYIILHHHHHHLYLHYLGTRKKRRIQQKFRRQNNIDYIITHVHFLNQCATAKVAKLSSWMLLI